MRMLWPIAPWTRGAFASVATEMITAILLAAGESTRMGRLKQLLPWAGTTLLGWQVAQLSAGGADEVIVVLGHAEEEISAALDDNGIEARLVVNEAYLEGRASSLRRGALAANGQTEALIVASVDQPRPAWVVRRLIEQQRTNNSIIVMPRFAGRGGHPVLLSGGLLDELRNVTDQDLGLRAVLDRHADAIDRIDFEDATVNVDLNTPDEYHDALAALGQDRWNERQG